MAECLCQEIPAFWQTERTAIALHVAALRGGRPSVSSCLPMAGWVLASHQVGAALVWYASGALCAVAALMALVIRRRRPTATAGGGSVAVAGA